jgi:FAD/FMN-containing dehydrogenase
MSRIWSVPCAWAAERGWKLGIRSGGHSWAGSHLRDGGLLLDVTLAKHDLFFPAGH